MAHKIVAEYEIVRPGGRVGPCRATQLCLDANRYTGNGDNLAEALECAEGWDTSIIQDKLPFHEDCWYCVSILVKQADV